MDTAHNTSDRQRVRALARAARKSGIACRLSISHAGYGAHRRAMHELGLYGICPPAQWAYSTLNSREASAYYDNPYRGNRLDGELELHCDSAATAAALAQLAPTFGLCAHTSGSDCCLTAMGGAS